MKSYNCLTLCLLAVLFVTTNGGVVAESTTKVISGDDILPSGKIAISNETVTNKASSSVSPLKNNAEESILSTTPAVVDTTLQKEVTTLPTPTAESTKTTTTAPETTPITTPSSPTTTNSTASSTTTISTTPTPETTTPTPASTATTPVSPTSTTILPSTSTTASPEVPCRRFDGPSFIGGIVLTFGVLAIGLVAYKFYKARNERNYHTL